MSFHKRPHPAVAALYAGQGLYLEHGFSYASGRFFGQQFNNGGGMLFQYTGISTIVHLQQCLYATLLIKVHPFTNAVAMGIRELSNLLITKTTHRFYIKAVQSFLN